MSDVIIPPRSPKKLFHPPLLFCLRVNEDEELGPDGRARRVGGGGGRGLTGGEAESEGGGLDKPGSCCPPLGEAGDSCEELPEAAGCAADLVEARGCVEVRDEAADSLEELVEDGGCLDDHVEAGDSSE